MVCAGAHATTRNDTKNCASVGKGDSGGPLVCPGSNGRFTLWGTLMGSKQCHRRLFTPGIYAKVAFFKEFIQQTVNASEKGGS